MIKIVERISDGMGILAAWLFFAIGMMVTYEVVSRYVFLSPTIWAEEMSQFFQIWATYLAAAHVLKQNHLIRIEFLIDRVDGRTRRLLEALTLIIIAVFAGVGFWYGLDIVRESIAQNRHTSTMLGVPKWMTESAIPVGMGLLFLQAAAQAIRLIIDKNLDFTSTAHEI